MSSDFSILSARFEALPQPVGPGWVMRVTAKARNIQHIAFPFVARVADQKVDFLYVNFAGDVFEGYLLHTPRPGDRLFVGYAEANTPTSIIFQPGSVGPAIV
jgi:hypothetical protein